MPVSITVQAPGLVRVEAAMGRVIRGLRVDAERRTRVFAEQMTAEMKAATPEGPGSDQRAAGTARASIHLSAESGGWVLVSDDPVVGFLLDGTPAHDILPSRKKALMFAMGDNPVFAKVVHHPGTQANTAMNAVRARASGQARVVAAQIAAAVVTLLKG